MRRLRRRGCSAAAAAGPTNSSRKARMWPTSASENGAAPRNVPEHGLSDAPGPPQSLSERVSERASE
eukprot:SAG25_NODE_427_length_8159_cov_9.134491_4_plen_67_part_00